MNTSAITSASISNFDSAAMNMSSAFQQMFDIAVKAKSAQALDSILDIMDEMWNKVTQAIEDCPEQEEVFESGNESSIEDAVVNQSESTTLLDSNSEHLTLIRKNVSKLNIIVKSIVTGQATVETIGKEPLLQFITDCYEGFESILQYIAEVEKQEGVTFPSQVAEYIKSRQSILTSCYDNVAISE